MTVIETLVRVAAGVVVPDEAHAAAGEGSVHVANFVIGASAALLSACLSSLGVNLQASALRAQRNINVIAETAAAASAAGMSQDGLQLLLDSESVLSHGQSQTNSSPTPQLEVATITSPRTPMPSPIAATYDDSNAVVEIVDAVSPGPPSSGLVLHVPPHGANRDTNPHPTLEPLNNHHIHTQLPPASTLASTSSASASVQPQPLTLDAMPHATKTTSSSLHNHRNLGLGHNVISSPTTTAEDGRSSRHRNRLTPDLGAFTLIRLLLGAPLLGRPLSRPERTEALHRMYFQSQWYLGFSLYLICQLFGSVIALWFISPVILAPLGAAGLIFNILFSRLFIGTRITRYDWIGTVLIVIGCAIVSTFGTTESETRQTIDDLIRLFSRPSFISYFSVQLTLVVCTFSLIKYLEYGLGSMRSMMISRSTRSSVSVPSRLHLVVPSQPESTTPLALQSPLFQHAYRTLPLRLNGHGSERLHHLHQLPRSGHKPSRLLRQSLSEPNLLQAGIRAEAMRMPLSPTHFVQHGTDMYVWQKKLHHHHRHSISKMPRRSAPQRRGSHVNIAQLVNEPDTLVSPTRVSHHHYQHHRHDLYHGHVDETQPLLQDDVDGDVAIDNILAGPRSSHGFTQEPGEDHTDMPLLNAVTIQVKRGQLTALIGVLYACVGGIAASETLMLTKSGVELIVISVFGSDNQFQGVFAFVLLAALCVTIFLQLYSLNQALHYHLPVVVIPVFYTLFTCLSLANTMVYLDQFGLYSGMDLAFLCIGIGVIVCGVWVLRKSREGGGDGGSPVGENGGGVLDV